MTEVATTALQDDNSKNLTTLQMNQSKRRQIFERFQAHNPHPVTELIYETPFELLIAVILSAQATDKSVNKATNKLFVIANTPEAIYALGEKKLYQQIKTIGLANTKTKNILKTCKLLLEKYPNGIPMNREDLETLPGVGRKTANVLLNTLFDHPTIAVDTHVFRVANRTKLAIGNTPVAVEKKLLKVTPPEFIANAHHWLVLHGRYICTARKPHCPTCCINDLCEYPDKTSPTICPSTLSSI